MGSSKARKLLIKLLVHCPLQGGWELRDFPFISHTTLKKMQHCLSQVRNCFPLGIFPPPSVKAPQSSMIKSSPIYSQKHIIIPTHLIFNYTKRNLSTVCESNAKLFLRINTFSFEYIQFLILLRILQVFCLLSSLNLEGINSKILRREKIIW